MKERKEKQRLKLIYIDALQDSNHLLSPTPKENRIKLEKGFSFVK